MVKISLLYGVEQLVCAAVLIVMVLNLSTTVYVATHGAVSWFIMGLMILAGIPLVWKELRILIHWERPSDESQVPAGETAAFQAVELQAPTVSGF